MTVLYAMEPVRHVLLLNVSRRYVSSCQHVRWATSGKLQRVLIGFERPCPGGEGN